jgi:hypothetical protein
MMNTGSMVIPPILDHESSTFTSFSVASATFSLRNPKEISFPKMVIKRKSRMTLLKWMFSFWPL